MTTARSELAAALRRHIAGEAECGTRRRAEYSTDASNYRVVPEVVAYPAGAEDVAAIVEIARERGSALTARGGGTSIAGNAVGPGIVLDFSRHMNRIEIDPASKTALVEPGAILGQIMAAAAPHSLTYGPDPSTWPRATIGGTIGNNACGPHALSAGRAADNVVEIDLIDGAGRAFRAARNCDPVPELARLVDQHLALIRTKFGQFKRQVSGYSLEHLLPERGRNLARFLAGSEGTLGVFTAMRVNLVDRAPAPALAVFGYPDMASAADAVPALLPHHPLAIEGIDERLVQVVRENMAVTVPELPRGAGWLLVEVGGESEEAALAAARALAADAGTADLMVFPAGPAARALWRIRADGAGLGGRTPSGKQGWPGWEDAAVPPERLGAYLREFETLLQDHGLDGLLYGHFGDGCVHVRIDFPLAEAGGVARTTRFLEDAARLVVAHGGSLSGEHGDGRTRSALLPLMYPKEAIALFGAVKHVFDPGGILNPGNIADPAPLEENLRRPAARPLGRSGFAFERDGGDFTDALHRCTGVAKCRADNTPSGGFMCPSYQATGDEKDTTRARARVLQEVANGTLITSFGAAEVRESLDLCLACKACSSDCPAGVDMAKYKAEATYRAYRGKLRPISHYVLGWLPRWATLIRKLRLARPLNALSRSRFATRLILGAGGMDSRREMVRFETFPLPRWAKRRAGAAPSGNTVVVWADSFSLSLDSTAAKDTVALLEEAGYQVLLAPEGACCGLTWITTGQLDGAKKRLANLARLLGPLAVNGYPIVGVEPSCTAVLRDDLVELLDGDPRARAIASATRTLAELLTDPKLKPANWQVPDLSGLTVVAQPHCHHHAVMGWQADAKLLAQSGATVRELAGCCGLAGNFGMEKGHYEVSVKVAEHSLLPSLRAEPDAVYLADGFSCRTQAAQLAGREGVHLATLLRGRPRGVGVQQ